MLVLTRCNGEAIVVGQDVYVTVLDVKGSQVRLGIKAPQTVSVDRKEIREKKQAPPTENK